jgi:hypothetical protein
MAFDNWKNWLFVFVAIIVFLWIWNRKDSKGNYLLKPIRDIVES